MECIVVNIPCNVEKFEIGLDGKKKNRSMIKGMFKRTYLNFYIFESFSGYKESFSKKTMGIDWNIII